MSDIATLTNVTSTGDSSLNEYNVHICLKNSVHIQQDTITQSIEEEKTAAVT